MPVRRGNPPLEPFWIRSFFEQSSIMVGLDNSQGSLSNTLDDFVCGRSEIGKKRNLCFSRGDAETDRLISIVPNSDGAKRKIANLDPPMRCDLYAAGSV